MLWRLDSAEDRTRIPNYEGQALNLSLSQQLEASSVPFSTLFSPEQQCQRDYDLLLVMNNFDDPVQLEASQQNTSLPMTQFDGLVPAVATAALNKCPVAFADVR